MQWLVYLVALVLLVLAFWQPTQESRDPVAIGESFVVAVLGASVVLLGWATGFWTLLVLVVLAAFVILALQGYSVLRLLMPKRTTS